MRPEKAEEISFRQLLSLFCNFYVTSPAYYIPTQATGKVGGGRWGNAQRFEKIKNKME